MKIETLPTHLVPQLETNKLMTRLMKGPMFVADDKFVLSNRSTLYKLGSQNGGKVNVKKRTIYIKKEATEVYEISFHE